MLHSQPLEGVKVWRCEAPGGPHLAAVRGAPGGGPAQLLGPVVPEPLQQEVVDR